MVGKILEGRYQIIKRIGGGGMAEVYKARCTVLNRYVAIKVLRNEYREDKEFISRFNTEAQAAASLTHPNIVSIFDVGCEHGVHYIVMEYVEGITLKQFIQNNKILSWRQALEFTVQICQAIDCAHKNGIVHRDIKPQNIMVCENNVLKVMDFGIARNLNKNGQTQDGKNSIGTVQYISPEQARGGYVDGKTDIYSIGVVLYEMMTGKLPFDHENPVSIAIMHMQQAPTPPRDLVLSIPAALEEVCLKAMSKEQAQRFQTAGEMLQALRQIQKTLGIAVTPPPTDYETRKFDRGQMQNAVDDFRDKERKNTKERGGGMSRTSGSRKRKGIKKENKKPMIAAIITAIILVGALMWALLNWIDPGFFGGASEGKITRIPNLVGKDLEKVLEQYEDEDLVEIIETKRELSEKYEEGIIAAQSPKAGTKVGKGKIKIKVVVSSGKKEGEEKMPSFSGKTLTDAKRILAKMNLSYEVVEEYSDTVTKNGIIRQIPKAGTKVDSDTQIILYVSKGEEKEEEIQVPYLIGMTQTQAKNALKEVGLKLGKVTIKDSDEPVGTVIGQDPGYQTELEEGDSVNIIISSGEAEATPEPEDTPAPTPETTPTPEAPATPAVTETAAPVEITPEPQAPATGSEGSGAVAE